MKIAQRLAANPGGTLPGAFTIPAELAAAYRFCNQKGVTYDSVIASHLERTRQECRTPGEYLIIEDTSTLDYSHHPATENLGYVGDGTGRGFDLHSALALRMESWNLGCEPQCTVVGLFNQECRAPRPAPRKENRKQRLKRPRKSQTWAAGFKLAGRPPVGCKWTYVADCESDFYEPMHICRLYGVDFVIRGYQDRCLADQKEHLRDALSKAPVLGCYPVQLRARPGQPARTAVVELRSIRVNLKGPWRPGGWQEPLEDIGVVEVTEINPPAGVKEPLHWVLMTSLPCQTLEEARKVVGIYTARWKIEEYHKALKTGTRVESSQLEKADRLEVLIAILAVVALRLLATKLVADSCPDGSDAAASFGPEMLKLLEKKFGVPKGGWTNRNVMITTARLGGFLARKSDGMPGWQTIWRGWYRLMWMAEGVSLM